MLTVEEKRARLSEIRAERNRLTTEIANLDARSMDAPEERRAGYEQRRDGCNTAIASLDEEAGELRGELTSDEQRIAEVRDAARNGSARTESGDGALGLGRATETPAQRDRTVQDAALRAIERHAGEVESGASERLEQLVRRDRTGLDAGYIAAIADEHWRTAFGKILAHGEAMAALRMTNEERAAVQRVGSAMELRAMAEGTGSAGGYGVPYALDPTILLSNNGAINPIRDLASIVQVLTNEWKGVSSEGVTAEFAAEGAEAEDGTPTLAQPKITLERAHAFVPFSIEMQMDYRGLEQELAGMLTDAKALLEAEKFLSGAGHASHEPEGVLTGLTNTQRVQTAAEKAIAVGDVYALKEAVPARFIVDAEWAASETTYDALWKLVAQADAAQAKIMDSRSGPLLGRPMQVWSSMSSAVTTSKAKPLVIGDWDMGFRIADRIGMSIELVPHLFGENGRPTGQRGVYAFWRTGSTVLIPNALRWLEVK